MADPLRAAGDAAEGLRRAGYIADVLSCSITLADIRITQGRLGEALRTYERALRLAADQQGLERSLQHRASPVVCLAA